VARHEINLGRSRWAPGLANILLILVLCWSPASPPAH
jgi:hypothetical protein